MVFMIKWEMFVNVVIWVYFISNLLALLFRFLGCGISESGVATLKKAKDLEKLSGWDTPMAIPGWP